MSSDNPSLVERSSVMLDVNYNTTCEESISDLSNASYRRTEVVRTGRPMESNLSETECSDEGSLEDC